MKKFLIVDGNSLTYRAFYAMPYLTNKYKQPSGAVYGFAKLLVKLILEQKPDYVAVCFDHAKKTFRNEIFADYKGTRKETPDDLKCQFPYVKQMLESMGVKVFEQDGIEADDLIGTLAKHSKYENLLISGDRDLLQLIDDNSTVLLTRKGVTEMERFDAEHLKEVWGIEPYEVIDLKALMGDSSDNIPGVPGIGEKTALSLLSKYDRLDGIYEHIDEISGRAKTKLLDGKDSAYMSQTLATIKTDCEIDYDTEKCAFSLPLPYKAKEFFQEWDFRSLANKSAMFAPPKAECKKDFGMKEFQSLQEVESFKNSITKYIAVDVPNLKFCDDKGNVFGLKKEFDLFSANLDGDEVLKIFKPIFEDKNILKITNSSKEDIKILEKLDCDFENFFDIEIARYVLYAGQTRFPVPNLNDYFSTMQELERLMKDQDLLKVYENIEIPLAGVLADMEKEGFKIDVAMLDELSEKYDKQIAQLVDDIYTLAGEEFNLNSPKQMASILFDKLGLVCENNKKQSTSFEVLDSIRWQHEIVDKIITFRKVNKLLNTYVKVYQEICAKNGAIVRTIFNQTLTSTGRLSSSEPNLQNIPMRDEEGKNMRKIFISKYENGKIVSADYNQIELRLLANLAHEERMISAFKMGVDIHTKTASEIFGVPIEEVTPQQRRDAKAVNFGIIYGISDYGLSLNIKTSIIRAKKYIESYFDRYPNIKTYMDANVQFARENGYVRSYFGRVRQIPEINSSNYGVRKFGERVAMNMPLQGTASDVIKIAMINIDREMKARKMKSHIILQVHDELIVDAVADEVEEVEKLLKEKMESVCDFEVPLTVSVSSGANLFDCK